MLLHTLLTTFNVVSLFVISLKLFCIFIVTKEHLLLMFLRVVIINKLVL